jgi:PEP-CTERM motif
MRLKGFSTPRLDKKLAGYTLIGAAAFTVTGIAHATDITYVPVGQSFNTTPGPSNYTLNLSGDTLPDFTITASGLEVSASAGNSAQILNDGDPAALVLGALIDPAGSNWGDGGKMSEVFSGNWPDNGRSAYLGFYFVGTDGDHAGWMNISTSTLPPGAAFTINSYGFDNNPNEAITAGEGDLNPIPAPVPEPSTLSLLAMGSAGLLELRRRRRANA